MTLIYAYQDRNCTRDIVIRDADGDPITPGIDDRLRVSIGRAGQTPLLTVVDNAPTANGSTLTKGATNRLRLDDKDLAAMDAGTYTLFIELLDTADASDWKNVDRQVFVLERT